MPTLLRTGLEGKVAAVTASDGPIAAACRDALAERGAEAVLLEPGRAASAALDVLVAILDAGHVPTPAVGGSADADWEGTVGSSARRLYGLVRDTAVGMAARGAGAIVVVAPEAGVAGVRGTSAVAAAAGALLASARALAIELAPPVRINTIAYGCIEGDPYSEWLRSADPNRTLELDGSLTLLERFGDPGELATAAAFLASDRASFIAAHQLVVDGGYLVH
jgi:3-oxoacyl-[acyl-carrier protein] reductase